MPIRYVEISSAGKLSYQAGMLKFCPQNGDPVRQVSLIELEQIVICYPSISISTALLEECAELSVVVTICNRKGYPISTIVPTVQNHALRDCLNLQVGLSEAQCKEIWAGIIRAKLFNQQEVLRGCSDNSGSLSKLANKVLAGDPQNIEAQAAKCYFRTLFGEKFRRDHEALGINAALNYGYAILRSTLVRAMIRNGISPEIGIFHKSKRNPLPLADDLLEPLRPFVDLLVAGLTESLGSTALSKEQRQQVAKVIEIPSIMHHRSVPLSSAIEEYSLEYRCLLKGERQDLVYPSLNLAMPNVQPPLLLQDNTYHVDVSTI